MPSPEPELVFALAQAIGTDTDDVIAHLERSLRDALFEVKLIRICDLLVAHPLLRPLVDAKDGTGRAGVRAVGTAVANENVEFRRRKTLMDAGDLLRTGTKRGDAAALLGVKELRNLRSSTPTPRGATAGHTSRGRAFVFHSVKHPAEIATLRRIYGPQLFVISVFSPRDARSRLLSKKLAEGTGLPQELVEPLAVRLLNRDAGLLDPQDQPELALSHSPDYLLNVRKTFEKADLFVSLTDRQQMAAQIDRFVKLVFGHPFHTPSRDELGMAVARTSALRSASLSRQVGASLMSAHGEIIGLGTNEVPRYGGGLYWEGDKPDGRDFQLDVDSSDEIRREILVDFTRRLMRLLEIEGRVATLPEGGGPANPKDAEQVVAMACESPITRRSRLLDVIEYGRGVHAEMAAITAAARAGVPVSGATLFCTTFPCHDCARHIVAAGIERVVYVEPYPKSRVAELYGDSIGLLDEKGEASARVRFEPFVGIAPRRFGDLFAWVVRKKADGVPGEAALSGKRIDWSLATAGIRESVLDAETIESGARAAATDAMEKHFMEAFGVRLKVWEASHGLPTAAQGE